MSRGPVDVLDDGGQQGEREDGSGQRGGRCGAGQGGQVAKVAHLQAVLGSSRHHRPIGSGRKLAAACSMEIEMLKHLAASRLWPF